MDDAPINTGGLGNSKTLRDWFAGLIMAGMMADPETAGMSLDRLAEQAYHAANALLKERDKR